VPRRRSRNTGSVACIFSRMAASPRAPSCARPVASRNPTPHSLCGRNEDAISWARRALSPSGDSGMRRSSFLHSSVFVCLICTLSVIPNVGQYAKNAGPGGPRRQAARSSRVYNRMLEDAGRRDERSKLPALSVEAGNDIRVSVASKPGMAGSDLTDLY